MFKGKGKDSKRLNKEDRKKAKDFRKQRKEGRGRAFAMMGMV